VSPASKNSTLCSRFYHAERVLSATAQFLVHLLAEGEMAQRLSTPDPSLSHTHLSIRRGRYAD